jgi:hypothetical protein
MVGARRCGMVWRGGCRVCVRRSWVILAVFEFIGVGVVVGGHGMLVGDCCGGLFAMVS